MIANPVSDPRHFEIPQCFALASMLQTALLVQPALPAGCQRTTDFNV